MDDEKYMLKKSAKGYLVKLDAETFYKLLGYKLSVFARGKKVVFIGFWKEGTQWRDEMPVNLPRFIMKAKKGQIIDHINRNNLDNRRSNLRTVSRRQNALNYSRCTARNIFYDVVIRNDLKNKGFRAIFTTREYKKVSLSFKFSLMGFFLAAVAHDKLVCESNSEDYAPLNFQMFKIPAFKKVLLDTDLKLLRSIYLGQKNKNSKKTVEKTKPEKKNTVYKNQFFFRFPVLIEHP
jgi:hypothetical protein